MKKKALREIPLPKADVKQIGSYSRVIVVQKKKVDGQETLVLNVYQVNNNKGISLLFRVFCQKDDYTTLEVDTDKWRTGALLYLTCGDSGWCEYWWNYNQMEFLTDKDADLVERTLRKWTGNHDIYEIRAAFKVLDKYQNHIKNVRLMKKHKKETDVIDAEMEKFGELPDDYQQFVEEKVFKDDNYIFYNTKERKAYCTSCKNTFLLENKHLRHATIGIWNYRDEVRHNNRVHCPYCHKLLKAKSEGMSRQSLVSVQWSVLLQPHGEEVLTRYFCHTKDFRIDFHDPKISISERYRTVHTAEKVTDYMWAQYKSTRDVRWCYYKEPSGMWSFPGETVCPRTTVLYNTNLTETIEGTCMKYSVLDIFIEKVAHDPRHFNSPWLVDNYFNSYRKYPFIEQLLKVGFYKIVQEFLEDSRFLKTEFNTGCNSILGTLGINKNQYNMLRKVGNPSCKDLEILKYKPDLKWDDFSLLRYVHDDGYVDMYKKFINMMPYTTLHKLCKYIKKQNISHTNDYFDYINWLTEMGYDMRNDFNLYPKHFKKAHDEKTKEYMNFKNEKEMEALKKFNEFMESFSKEANDVDALNLKLKGMFIRLPINSDELRKEGECLHHCVGTYIDRVMKGETLIFFIRKEEEPDKPFFTLEYKNEKVVQCRGFKNCEMTPEVKAFTKIFEEKMHEYAMKAAS